VDELLAVDPDRPAFFERVDLWPVRLTFLSKSGITLYGTAGTRDGHDRLLTQADRLVLARSEPQLRAFLNRDHSSSLVGLPGYEHLRTHVREGAARLDEILTWDYGAVARALHWPPAEWGLTACAALIDALNMLPELASALGDRELLAELDTPAYVAQRDLLGFAHDAMDDEVAEAVAALDRVLLRRIIGLGIQHVERRIAAPLS
jgi:hypothetical protein